MKNNKLSSFVLLILTIGIISSACNKTRQHSKWLTGQTWVVNEVSIDGSSFDLLPKLNFDDCDIYDEICFGTLQIENDGVANFAWQVREKGSIFELSDQTENVNQSNEEAVSFCSSFSGIYNVNNADKKSMELESNNCKRYPGKKVILKLSKE
jgi:hypothetical protein